MWLYNLDGDPDAISCSDEGIIHHVKWPFWSMFGSPVNVWCMVLPVGVKSSEHLNLRSYVYFQGCVPLSCLDKIKCRT